LAVATIAKSGTPDLDVVTWFDIPRPVIDRLNQAINRVAQSLETREWFLALGFEPRGKTPEDFEHHIKPELALWSGVINAQAINPEQATAGAGLRQSNIRCGT
jgi:tripartite-type tricarboxylate transporter receptor subunit TctC